MNSKVKKIWNIATTAIVVVVVVFTVLLVGARLFGFNVLYVTSGSMEPEYPTGSLLYVKKVDPYKIEVGQVITFMLDEDTLATHRVVEILKDESDPSVIRFATKGDANNANDGTPVHYKNVVGTPVFSIPYLGYVAAYIQDPPGMYMAIAAGAVLLLLILLPDLFDGDANAKKSKKAKNADKNEKTLSDEEKSADGSDKTE